MAARLGIAVAAGNRTGNKFCSGAAALLEEVVDHPAQ
jgi:hypothetical protein